MPPDRAAPAAPAAERGGAPPARIACKPEACAIQECLAASDYQEARCAAQIAALIACCDADAAAAAPGDAKPAQCAFGARYRALAAKHLEARRAGHK
ncbi:MAG: hypothetical protein J3K34DRAFT_431987 [Monoraphidium minutum]|nr:MAG: hypothetical protein J3K34DRAFT_431987 [Monoraphidium minutum]